MKEEIEMRSGTRTKTHNLFLIPLLLIAMSIMDWNHFFPFSAQPDLLFQSTGELIELAALVGAIVLMSLGIAKLRGDGKKAGGGAIFRLLVAASFGSLLITLGWRDFFPGHRFILSAGSSHLAGALFGGLVFAIAGFSLQGVKGIPSREEEKSVV
jgi:hypothetical protein